MNRKLNAGAILIVLLAVAGAILLVMYRFSEAPTGGAPTGPPGGGGGGAKKAAPAPGDKSAKKTVAH